MLPKINHKNAIVLALSIFVSACGGGSLNESVADSVAQVIGQAQENENENENEPTDNNSVGDELAEIEATDNNAANEVVNNNTTDTTDNDTVFEPSRFAVSECGSVPSATTASSSSMSNPAQFFVDEPVDGQLIPGSPTNSFHIWQIALDAGNYHLVVDAFDILDHQSEIGINVTSLATDNADNEDLLVGLDIGFDLRSVEYLEIRNPQVLTLRVETRFSQIHNYTMGIFSNDTAVPSPTFNRCQPVNSLAFDTTQSVTLQSSTSRDDDIFYRLELTSGEYRLSASTSTPEDSFLGYQFDLLKDFGETQDAFTISTSSGFSSLIITDDSFENSFEGTAWLRLRNRPNDDDDDVIVVFTLSEL